MLSADDIILTHGSEKYVHESYLYTAVAQAAGRTISSQRFAISRDRCANADIRAATDARSSLRWTDDVRYCAFAYELEICECHARIYRDTVGSRKPQKIGR